MQKVKQHRNTPKNNKVEKTKFKKGWKSIKTSLNTKKAKEDDIKIGNEISTNLTKLLKPVQTIAIKQKNNNAIPNSSITLSNANSFTVSLL